MQVENIKKGTKELIKANNKPYGRTCRIKIGNMFDSFDMVIDAVDIKYSRQNIYSHESNSKGKSKFDSKKAIGGNVQDNLVPGLNNLQAYQPLYVDVSLRVSTRTVPSVDEEGNANTGLIRPQPSVSLASEVDDIIGLNED